MYNRRRQPDIRNTPLEYRLHGLPLKHDLSKGYGEEVLGQLGRPRPVLKAERPENGDLNRVVYDGRRGCSPWWWWR
ncbi:MAG: hypothetical protein K2Q09_09020, partial [Phycisphaerales bacterium]|nr:hypothetical protein [Phycisphaerales bacterium]